MDRALQIFNKCRRKGHKFDTATFNNILHGLAAKKKLIDFQVFFHSMVGDNVQANVQTYCTALELYGQLKNINMIKETCEKIQAQVCVEFSTCNLNYQLFLFHYWSSLPKVKR